MEQHKNKYEQVCKIRHLLAINIKILTVGVILVILALFSFYYWKNHQSYSSDGASWSYETTVSKIRTDQPQTLAAAERFVTENKNSYGVLVALKITQQYIDKDLLDKAVIQLKRISAITKDDNLKSLINLRLARIQIQQEKADDALKTLYTIQGEGFSGIISDLCGEALLIKGDKQGAYTTWERGVKNNLSPTLREIMEMKINNLSV